MQQRPIKDFSLKAWLYYFFWFPFNFQDTDLHRNMFSFLFFVDPNWVLFEMNVSILWIGLDSDKAFTINQMTGKFTDLDTNEGQILCQPKNLSIRSHAGRSRAGSMDRRKSFSKIPAFSKRLIGRNRIIYESWMKLELDMKIWIKRCLINDPTIKLTVPRALDNIEE